MTTEKKGTLSYIAQKTGRVILKEEPKIWYNAVGGIEIPASLKGKQVILHMLNQKQFVSIELDKSTKPIEIHQEDRSEVLIVREVSAKCAAEMANSLKEFTDIAEAVERWILR
jgi:hypothetical protein